MYYIGLLSGTSMDAIDCALVDFSTNRPVLLDYRQSPIDQSRQEKLISIDENTGIGEITRLDVYLGKLFAKAAKDLISNNQIKASQVAAIGVHGQTVLHRPEQPEPTTLQIGDPNIIAHLTGIPVVADFRRMDMAAGGQGAPLAPVFHQYVFQHENEHRVVLNIGGISNITVLPSIESGLPVTGFDTGPGNVLLDAWSMQCIHKKMDMNGEWAATGKTDKKLLAHLLEDVYFKLPPPKSTGRDYFNASWLLKKLENFGEKVSSENVQTTLTELTTNSICTAISDFAPATQTVIVCGGGVHNKFLMQVLAKTMSGCKVISTGEINVNPDAVEGMTFALLAKYRLENNPGNIPSVTGANQPVILGAVYLPASQI